MQDAMTPEMAIDILKKGNDRFVNNLKENRNLLQQANETSDGQHPFAIVLSCIDSRTSAELIFDQGLGDIFSVRIAGNIANEDILGSMEFACKVAGARAIVVLGHSKCGAVKGACDDVKLGNLTGLLDKLKPAVNAVRAASPSGSQTAEDFVETVASTNVKLTMKVIQDRSPIIAEMLAKKEIRMIGGMYHLDSGLVDFYEL